MNGEYVFVFDFWRVCYFYCPARIKGDCVLKPDSWGGVAFTVTLVRTLHRLNACSSMKVTDVPIVTSVRLLQFLKALSPIIVTESGIVTLVRLLQSQKELIPISVTESGMVILVRSLQLLNVHSPI